MYLWTFYFLQKRFKEDFPNVGSIPSHNCIRGWWLNWSLSPPTILTTVLGMDNSLICSSSNRRGPLKSLETSFMITRCNFRFLFLLRKHRPPLHYNSQILGSCSDRSLWFRSNHIWSSTGSTRCSLPPHGRSQRRGAGATVASLHPPPLLC